MQKRDLIRLILEGKRPPYVPWSMGFTKEAREKLQAHYGCDDLIAAGLNCFNPFQPEVMDVYGLLKRYRGRLAFHGGMSTQRTMPFGSIDDVRAETTRLLEAGADGGYIFAPAHDVEGDVPLENMLAAIDIVQQQPAFRRSEG